MKAQQRSKISQIDPRNQQGLRHIFNLTTTQVNPDQVDMTMVQPVVDMNMCGYAKLPDQRNMMEGYVSENINDVNSQTHELISYVSRRDLINPGELVYAANHNLLVFALDFFLYPTNADHFTTSALWHFIAIEMYVPDHLDPITIWRCKWTRHANNRDYYYLPPELDINQGGPGLRQCPAFIVPAGCWVNFRVQSADVAFAPEPTTTHLTYLGLSVHVKGLQVPQGAPIPQLNF